MVLAPARWITNLMELTSMSKDFEFFLILIGLGYLTVAWAYEHYMALRLARIIGTVQQRVTGTAKKRKQYKIILENARV